MVLRVAIVDPKKCNPSKCHFECGTYCPVNRIGKTCIWIGETTKKSTISEELCIGCGICVKKCPFGAIDIINLPEEPEKPVHRYSYNGFRLYGLPIPQKGVVGILGPNGIGKTTAINILGNKILPNLGIADQHKTQKQIIDYYKGTELQNYFQNLYQSKDFQVSIKPQYVHEIPRLFPNKTVKGLFEHLKINNYTKICEYLKITNILDRQIQNLSGGELQKLACSLALSKQADIYFFDEPISYLDIKERIRVANQIMKLQDKFTFVIEHDLLILDYLSDLVHIVWGKKAAYGVFSPSYSSKEGINIFLEGFLPDKNLKFRDKALRFTLDDSHTTGKQELLSYTEIKKSYENFSVEISPGKIYLGEVLGIAGPNATGKTTFMKILAGVEKPDLGNLNKTIKISYKPQYPQNESSQTVLEFLSKHKNYFDSSYKLELLDPLKIDELQDKIVSELSGGELQKIMIANCLLQEADLYLLDEPSTFLDVEERLNVAKIIKDFIHKKNVSAAVIEHDFMLLYHISDRLLVFEGEPSINGKASDATSVREGLNKLLKFLDITLRKDPLSGRPRVNKKDSVKDKEQKQSGNYFER